MTESASGPVLHHVQCLHLGGLHRMAYWEWACRDESPEAASRPVVVCVHGLTRQGRDFDTLARELSRTHRVICPDVVGRGQSDWLPDGSGYQVPTYAADMVTLLARLNAPEIAWVGTSMGGLIGMVLASLKDSPIRRLVLNDVGPSIQADAIARIAQYVGTRMHFATFGEAMTYVSSISVSFGPHTPQAWEALTRPQFKPLEDGSWQAHYDPAIAVPLKAATAEDAVKGEALLWHCYQQITAPTLVMRGALSDLLSPETVRRMREVGPKAEIVEVEGVCHAPTLVDPWQIKRVTDFLRAQASA